MNGLNPLQYLDRRSDGVANRIWLDSLKHDRVANVFDQMKMYVSKEI